MNSSFGIWLLIAGVAAVALLLLLGIPAIDREAVAEPEIAEVVAADVVTSAPPTIADSPSAVTSTRSAGPAAAPCPACGSTSVCQGTAVSRVGGCGTPTTSCAAPSCTRCNPRPSMAAPVVASGTLVGGCGVPAAACAAPVCPRCQQAQPTPVAVPVGPSGTLSGGCGMPDVPCGQVPCGAMIRPCYDVCTDPCRMLKPGINRNMSLCVNECSLVQLRSTVAHPICEQVSFEWSASKGWFIDPASSDPLFFAPTTQFAQGEDVWITLVVTDASGAQFTDAIGLHVRDLP